MNGNIFLRQKSLQSKPINLQSNTKYEFQVAFACRGAWLFIPVGQVHHTLPHPRLQPYIHMQ